MFWRLNGGSAPISGRRRRGANLRKRQYVWATCNLSGGQTSTLMTKLINDRQAGRYGEIFAVVFANTGEENEETLRFVYRCASAFGWNVVGVDAAN